VPFSSAFLIHLNSDDPATLFVALGVLMYGAWTFTCDTRVGCGNQKIQLRSNDMSTEREATYEVVRSQGVTSIFANPGSNEDRSSRITPRSAWNCSELDRWRVG
jgi:hypothetical protein